MSNHKIEYRDGDPSTISWADLYKVFSESDAAGCEAFDGESSLAKTNVEARVAFLEERWVESQGIIGLLLAKLSAKESHGGFFYRKERPTMNRVFDIWTKPPTDRCEEWAVGIGQYLRFTMTQKAALAHETGLDEVMALCAQRANLLFEEDDLREVACYGEDGQRYTVPASTVKADLLLHVIEEGV